jgi:hypothetical protein
MMLLLAALGLFYLAMALLVLRRALAEWSAGRPGIGRAFSNRPDGRRLLFMTMSAGLYGAAGLALLAKSHMAVWLLGGGLMAQAAYYGLEWLSGMQPMNRPDGRADRVLIAAMISAASFALAAYAVRIGMLT